jgi:hypothetical protein
MHISFARTKFVFRVETWYVDYLPLAPVGWFRHHRPPLEK